MSLLLSIAAVCAMALSPGSLDGVPPHGVVIAVHGAPDGTALVAWTTKAADYITHVDRDGTVLSAELASARLDGDVFEKLDDVVDECGGFGCGTYHGKRVVLHERSIWIDGAERELPIVVRASTLEPVRLRPIRGELPQFVGIDTAEGPVVLDLETFAVVWRDGSADLVARDGMQLYLLGDGRVRAFDPLTFTVRLAATNVEPDQIGGGYVWSYDAGKHAIDAPVVHAFAPAPRAAVTAQR